MPVRKKIPMDELDRFRERLESHPPEEVVVKQEVLEIPLEHLVPASWNARRYFDERKIIELMLDIQQNSLIHPLVVRPLGDKFEVVVGERRFRAVSRAKFVRVKCSVRHLSDLEARRMGLSENLERTDLNAYEETLGWLDLLELNLSPEAGFQQFTIDKKPVQDVVISVLRRYKHEMEKVRHNVTPNPLPYLQQADQMVVGTTLERVILETFSSERMTWKSFIENRLPLLQLPEDLLEHLRAGRLEYTKAKEIGKLEDAGQRIEFCDEVLRLNLPLTQIRTRIKALLSPTLSVNKSQLVERRLQKLGKAVREGRRKLSKQHQTRLDELLFELEGLLGVTKD